MKLIVIFFFLFGTSVYSQNILTQVFEVYFSKNNIDLTDEAKDSVYQFLLSLGNSRIQSVNLAGYSDEEKIMLFNLTLSERRAKEVRDFIESTKRVRGDLISYRGYGKLSTKNKNAVEITVNYFPGEVSKAKEKQYVSRISKDSLVAGKSIRLNLNFFPGESRLLPSAFPFLAELELFLKDNPEINIEIIGHVCCSNNLELSVDRAFEVYDQLVSKGINPTRLSYKGMGNTRPLVEEDTDKDKEINRRVEIKLKK